VDRIIDNSGMERMKYGGEAMNAKHQRRGCWFFVLLTMWAWSFTGAAVYTGNGNSGFGGPVELGSLVIASDETNVYFKLEAIKRKLGM